MASTEKKFDQELLQLNLYDILGLVIDASDAQIKRAFRKKALKCHPDKNPDNPAAAAEFDRLKKILEILVDSGSRAAYDRVLKNRQLADVRRKAASAKSRKFRDALDTREQEAKEKLSSEQRFARELKRLEEEGAKLIAEELAKLNEEQRAETPQDLGAWSQGNKPETTSELEGSFKVLVKWTASEGTDSYTKDTIKDIFSKWGDINEVVIQQKSKKGRALVDYCTKDGAEMASSYELGLPECPITVKEVEPKATEATPLHKAETTQKRAADDKIRNYESLADMEKRRRNERARLIEEIRRNDGLNEDSS